MDNEDFKGFIDLMGVMLVTIILIILALIAFGVPIGINYASVIILTLTVSWLGLKLREQYV
jgi:hypothetical protein